MNDLQKLYGPTKYSPAHTASGKESTGCCRAWSVYARPGRGGGLLAALGTMTKARPYRCARLTTGGL